MEEIKLKLKNEVDEMFQSIIDFNDWVDVGNSEIEIGDDKVIYKITFKLIGIEMVESLIEVYKNIPKDGCDRWLLSVGDVKHNTIADILKPYFTSLLIERYNELVDNEN